MRGKVAVQVNRETIDEDHPRLCGEKPVNVL